MACLPKFSAVISISFVSSRSHTGLYDSIYAPTHYTSELVLLINLCLFSSLCHYHKFLFDRKHRWVQEKLVLLFHFPAWYLLSHANPLTPVMTSDPLTLFTITNVIIVIQANNASSLGTKATGMDTTMHFVVICLWILKHLDGVLSKTFHWNL